MKRLLILALVILLLNGLSQARAQGRVCNPFTTTPDEGMLPIGQVVEFEHWEGGPRPVLRVGQVSAYYILSCWPGTAVPGLEAQAYVVNYGSADGSQVVLNRVAISTQ